MANLTARQTHKYQHNLPIRLPFYISSRPIYGSLKRIQAFRWSRYQTRLVLHHPPAMLALKYDYDQKVWLQRNGFAMIVTIVAVEVDDGFYF